MLTDYTDTNTVRAFLGVNELELEDVTIQLAAYNLAIEDGLDALSTAIAPLYLTIKTIVAGDRTPQQARFFTQVQTYSAALAADALMGAMPMFAPKKIEDSKAALERVNDPYTALAANIKATLAVLASRLLTSLGILEPGSAVTTVARRYAAAIPLGTDPVTGA